MRQHILFWLQIFQVAILLLHDWIPLAPLNDLRAVRRGHSFSAMALGTVLVLSFPSVGLVLSLFYRNSKWPGWLYVLFLGRGRIPVHCTIGSLADSIPAGPQPKRATENETMY